MTERVLILDTTLRDGLQGRDITSKDRLEVFAALDRAGLDVIEIGVVSPKLEDIQPIRDAATAIETAQVCVLAYPKAAAIDRAGQALADHDNARLHVFNSVIVRGGTDASADDQDRTLAAIRETVARAGRHCADVQWAALDASRAVPDFLCRAVAAAVDAGAKTINLADTMGTMLPDEFGALVADVCNRVPNIDKAAIAVHCHNDLGLATANSLAGIAAGARQIECAVNGLGPKGGNTSLQDIVSVLTQRPDRFPPIGAIEPNNLATIGQMVSDTVK